ncbi:MAG: hypothetical protein ABR563_04045 [Pyrinomonadaceae bacterium]
MKSKKWRLGKRKHASPGGGDGAARQAKAEGAAAPATVGRVAPTGSRLSWRGVILDLTVVAANLFLVGRLARLLRAGGQAFLAPDREGGGRVSPAVGWLFLSVFAAHALGALLKLLSRQAQTDGRTDEDTNDGDSQRAANRDDITAGQRRRRLRRVASRWRGSPGKALVFAACALLVFHFAIFLMLLSAGWQGTGLDDWVSVFGKGTGGDSSPFFGFLVRFVLIVFVLPAPTFLVAISLGAGDDAPPPSQPTHWVTELFADLLLYYSIIVITVAMNVVVAPRFVSVGGAERTFGDLLASLIPLALAFSIIYLPPRLIYLAQDYKAPLTWLTILLALLALAYRTFFPGDLSSW